MATPFPFTSGQTLTAAQMNAITTLPSTTKTADHTLVIADQGTRVIMNVATANTVTVNTSIFGAGDIVEIQNIGAGVCTVTAGTATVSSAGPLAIPQFGGGRLVFSSASAATYFPTAVTAAVGQTVAIFNETQASGTAGGTFTSGSFLKRTLNTTVVNQITSCTLTSSVISLPAGTYLVFATAPALMTDSHQTRLRNTTDSTDIQFGSSEINNSTADYATTISNIQTVFTLTATKNIELQHRATTTRATFGFGNNSAFGNSNIFAQITITKIA